MNPRNLYQRWNLYWQDYSSPTSVGKLSMDLSTRLVREVLNRIEYPPDGHILEIGCGSGRTLGLLKEWGYYRAIGIDYSPRSLELCGQHNLEEGRDVFLMDAEQTGFSRDSFSLLFAEGVLEHFTDFNPMVAEMCRLSSRYILLTQPNHFSPLGRLSHLLQDKFRNNVREYSYHWQEFRDSFSAHGFRLILKKNTLLGDVWILLFEANGDRKAGNG